MTIYNEDALSDCIHWVVERERIRKRRQEGRPQAEWTKDTILAKYRFCNVRREDDVVTQWIDNNIRRRFENDPYLWWMLCCARVINWPDTLAALIDSMYTWPGDSSPHFTLTDLARELEHLSKTRKKVFTGAYTITAPPQKGRSKADFVVFETLGSLWRDRDRFTRLFETRPTLEQVHTLLMRYPAWGPFMAYQAVVDMRFTSLLNRAEDRHTWCAAGPGTLRGINRMLGRGVSAAMTQDTALRELQQLDRIVTRESGVQFDFSDMPNIMCETDKYLRVKHGEGAPRALYRPHKGTNGRS